MDTAITWLAAALSALTGLIAPSNDSHGYFGYAEGDYVYIAPDVGGIITEVVVAEGDGVKVGALLFTLEGDRAEKAVEGAKAAVGSAQAKMRNLETGARPEELRVIQQQLQSARDSLQLARKTFNRSETLSLSKIVPVSKLDADRTALEMAKDEVARLEAQLKVARLPARDEQIAAARQDVARAEANLASAQIDLAKRRVSAPVGGYVDRVFLDPGEYAAPGTPAIALLPPENIKIRFFVPEPARTGIRVGDRVLVSCSSCATPLPATVTYLAANAEHTPPVIYSREERSKLVFAVEARLAQPGELNPGQPVDVRPVP